jgi:hypothetical protein
LAMKTCGKCNAEVGDGLEICPECGFPFESPAPVECPSCRNMVVFTSGLCPTCGVPHDKLAAGATSEVAEAAAGTGEPNALASEAPSAEPPSDETLPDETQTGVVPAAETVDVIGAVEGAENLTPTSTYFQPSPGQSAPNDQAASLRAMSVGRSGNGLSDNDYIIKAIVDHITTVRADLVNNPTKAFTQILTELDNSNKEFQQTVLQQGQDILIKVQENSQEALAEISRLTTEQGQETSNKIKELAVTLVSEMAILKEAQSAAAQLQKVPAAPATQSESDPGASGANNYAEYTMYLCAAMLLFTILDFFITIYAVKLLR